MASKRLKIENLEHLSELNPEEFYLLQGGEARENASESSRLIYVDPENPTIKPDTLPKWPTKPYYPLPYYPCSPYPNGKLPWCAVIL